MRVELLLHKATVEADPGLKPELQSEEANTNVLPLTTTVPDLVMECRKWRSCQTLFFPALYHLNKELHNLLARVNAFTDSQPKAVSGRKLDGQDKPLVPLSLDWAAHEGQPEPKGKMGHG